MYFLAIYVWLSFEYIFSFCFEKYYLEKELKIKVIFFLMF